MSKNYIVKFIVSVVLFIILPFDVSACVTEGEGAYTVSFGVKIFLYLFYFLGMPFIVFVQGGSNRGSAYGACFFVFLSVFSIFPWHFVSISILYFPMFPFIVYQLVWSILFPYKKRKSKNIEALL